MKLRMSEKIKTAQGSYKQKRQPPARRNTFLKIKKEWREKSMQRWDWLPPGELRTVIGPLESCRAALKDELEQSHRLY
ncbi:hypothetical protein KQX54_009032 [Cotesia glomerata]|uniref:Uncharacterized protein n=1 Tax=Cotesia glomerata TaxID=32391 RepID=A0AAV7J2L8_COTGL|nr:hypothetical protein KQX54_009032 [Cotesia glomerata]